MTERQTFVPGLQRTVLLELDFAVLHALKSHAEASRTVLAAFGLDLDEMAFLKTFVGRTPAQGVAAAAQAAGRSVDAAALAAALVAACRQATLKALGEAKAVCGALVKDLLARDLRVAFVTGAPEAEAQQALTQWCDGQAAVVCEAQSLCGCYTWENWRRAARKLQSRERLSVAVVGSGLSAKSALTSGMYVIAHPDPLAECQDYSGVDALVPKLDGATRAEILRLLRA